MRCGCLYRYFGAGRYLTPRGHFRRAHGLQAGGAVPRDGTLRELVVKVKWAVSLVLGTACGGGVVEVVMRTTSD